MSNPGNRRERQRKARETRRLLASITPETSHPQTQSSLCSSLPAEIRFQIFQYVLSQQCDLTREWNVQFFNPFHRPGHTHHTILDLSLLLTCRLIYYEAHAIPWRSATRHFQSIWVPPRQKSDMWINHITKDCGRELYHIHDTLLEPCLENFSKFLLLHLRWRKVTWTVCAYLLPLRQKGKDMMASLAETLAGLTLPSSCEEVNVELEVRFRPSCDWTEIREQVRACREVKFERRDNSSLEFDEKHSLQYKWIRDGQSPLHTEAFDFTELATYITIRLCWRAKIARREYMSYDYIDCLNLQDRSEVMEVVPLSEIL